MSARLGVRILVLRMRVSYHTFGFIRKLQKYNHILCNFNSGRRRFKYCHFIWFTISACRDKSADVERNGDVFHISGAAAARVRPVSARGHLFIKAMCLK